MKDLYRHLINYGLQQMQQVTGINTAGWPGRENVKWVEPFEELLGTDWPKPESVLTSIFCRVHLPESGQEDTRAYLRPAPLEVMGEPITEGGERSPLFPRPEPPSDLDEAKLSVGEEFAEAYADLQRMLELDDHRFFTAFYHLMERFAWALPNTYGEPGVSLFQQWKAVAALTFASGGVDKSAEHLTLVGGDIPGIQDFVYTITSKGAAKGLRGRSFFLQLLGDAVVRRILAELGLCWCNVIYNAGGNFMVLGPGSDAEIEGKTLLERLEELQEEIDGALLDVFEGDLALCMAWVPLQASEVCSQEFANPVSKTLKGLIAGRKRQRFSAIAKNHWNDLFSPRGKPGNRFCVICQRPLGRNEGVEMEGQDDLQPEERSRRCETCDGFKILAERIGRKQEGLLAVGREPTNGKGKRWQKALWEVGHVWYDFGLLEKLDPPSGAVLYTINRSDFLSNYAHGFTFIANVTPRVTGADLKRWQERPEEGEEPPHLDGNGIRTFSQMADVARGVKRLGVLRMDVDNLGQIMVRGFNRRSLAATSALSEALDRFFAGWLNRICAEVNQLHRMAENGEDRGDRLYVIYAGGDDLFIVGSWDLMPALAGLIRTHFNAYTGDNPALHISAGITLEGRKFPLYQAAGRAGRAEDQAKKHSRKEVQKDAINFLGLPVKWNEWVREVQPRFEVITELVMPEKAPKALIQVLQNIYAQYEEQVKRMNEALRDKGEPIPDEPQYQVYYGPWMWREAYALTRMAERIHRDGNEKAAKEVLGLQVSCVSPVSVCYIGLAARWAELLTREEKE